MPTGEGFFPADLLEKVDEVANLVDACLIAEMVESFTATTRKRRIERQPRSRLSAFPRTSN